MVLSEVFEFWLVLNHEACLFGCLGLVARRFCQGNVDQSWQRVWETVVDGPEVLITVRTRPDIGGGKVDWKEGAAVAIISNIKSGVFVLKHQILSYCVVSESWSGIWLVSFRMI